MQKFQKGDWVRVAKDLGRAMSHFPADCEAIVIGSYADKYGGRDRNSFTLHIKGEGECSWYNGNQLTLIESGRLDKLQAWEKGLPYAEMSDADIIAAGGVVTVKEWATVPAHGYAREKRTVYRMPDGRRQPGPWKPA